MLIHIALFLLIAEVHCEEICTRSAKLDLQLIVDSSVSVTRESFNVMMKEIADSVVGQFDIAKDKTRVALFKYSKAMVNEFGLKTYSDIGAVKTAMKKVKYKRGYTNTAEALRKSLKSYTKLMRHDKLTAHVCIVFTDGQASDAEEVPAATKAWARKGVSVFAVGIGNLIDKEGLTAIAGSEDRVLQASDFEAIGAIAKSLLVKVCEVIVHPCDQPSKGGCAQICNKAGSGVICACQNGFKLNPDKKTCKKVHPCDQPSKGGCSQICKKEGSSAICACQNGFQLNPDKKTCTKVHPCDLPSKGGCAQICQKQGSGVICICQSGFNLNPDKKTCKKVHPCDLPSKGGCAQICQKQGSGVICICQNGFNLNHDKKTCKKAECKWFCTVTQNRGVIARTTNLQQAQRPLGHGNKHNRQAIIPMTNTHAGDPHTLAKNWGSGSMWWWDWWDINQMRDKCSRQQPLCNGRNPPRPPVGPLKWFCAVRINGGVRLKTTDLGAAQRSLGRGNKHNRQAIIPMTNRQSGDPHTLSKSWGGGSMWWWGWGDIHNMQRQCAGAGLP